MTTPCQAEKPMGRFFISVVFVEESCYNGSNHVKHTETEAFLWNIAFWARPA